MIKPVPTPPPKVTNRSALIIPYVYILILLSLALWQLIGLESFTSQLATYLGTPLTGNTVMLAAGLIAIEVFSLPFLLRLHLSPLARFCSAALSGLTPFVLAGVVLLSPKPNIWYIVLSVALCVWGFLSFRVLGGPKALYPKLK